MAQTPVQLSRSEPEDADSAGRRRGRDFPIFYETAGPFRGLFQCGGLVAFEIRQMFHGAHSQGDSAQPNYLREKTMKNIGYLCVIAAVALCVSVPAAKADDLGRQPQELFEKLDGNGDGSITPDEVSEDRGRFFDRLIRIGDKNDDAKLSREEFLNALRDSDPPFAAPGQFGRGAGRNREFEPKRMFKRLDGDGNGKLSLDEIPERFRDRIRPLFDRLGKDEVTEEDFAQIRRPGRPGDMPRPEQLYRRLDTNGDGSLTLDEVPERAKRGISALFEQAGKDKDASLSQQEFAELIAEHLNDRRARGPFNRRDGDRPARPAAPARPDKPRGPQDPDRPDKPRPLGPPRGEGFRGPRILRLLDTDGDRRLSKQELAAAAEKFDRLDENGDEQLDPRELFGPPPRDRRPERRFDRDRFRRDRPDQGRADRKASDRSLRDLRDD